MKQLIPQNDYVLCTKTTEDEKHLSNGFAYKSDDLSIYKIVGIGPSLKIGLQVGDSIVVNSTGTLAKFNGISYFLFKEENIMGKIVD